MSEEMSDAQLRSALEARLEEAQWWATKMPRMTLYEQCGGPQRIAGIKAALAAQPATVRPDAPSLKDGIRAGLDAVGITRLQYEYFTRGRHWEISEFKRHLIEHAPKIPGLCSWCRLESENGPATAPATSAEPPFEYLQRGDEVWVRGTVMTVNPDRLAVAVVGGTGTSIIHSPMDVRAALRQPGTPAKERSRES